MKERPILFSAPMVRALLAGRKSQTRRLVRPPHDLLLAGGASPSSLARVPYGEPGDRLWVREQMRVLGCGQLTPGAPEERPLVVRVRYEADGTESGWLDYPERLAVPVVGKCLAYGGHREASRILLEVVSVRAERLHEISEQDAEAEGVRLVQATARDAFAELWDQINGKRAAWSTNPWVWVVRFTRAPGRP